MDCKSKLARFDFYALLCILYIYFYTFHFNIVFTLDLMKLFSCHFNDNCIIYLSYYYYIYILNNKFKKKIYVNEYV